MYNFIQQKSLATICGGMNRVQYLIQWGFNPLLNKVKASGGCLRFLEVAFRASSKKSGRKYAKAHLIIKWLLVLTLSLLLTGCRAEQYTKIEASKDQIIVVNLLESSLSFFDQDTKEELARWTIPYTFTGALLLPDNKTLLLYGKHLKKIYLYDITTGTEVDRWKTGKGIVNVQISNDDSKLFLANQENDKIQVRTVSGEKVAEVTVGDDPLTILESKKRHQLFAINFNAPEITVIDSRSYEKTKVIHAKPASVGAVLIEPYDELWTGGHGVGYKTENAVTVYSLDTGDIKEEIKAPIMPVDLEKWEDYVFVVSHGSNQLRKINIHTKEVVAVKEIGANPFKISIINNLIYIASYDSNEIIEVDPTTMEIVDTIQAGKGPFQILFKKEV
ncbi:hypothetical protein M670_00055 [Schinkia azotoformans MEV2011]|uniref:Uncharacterized protein n=1 Tax=Schinkia azotoformans MEV2011 TaxID=1348973 RepID=A0A072NT41_SCHAZ|nr:hypothetical protein M670_00055 [Schinkia azotoformans MEV2011]